MQYDVSSILSISKTGVLGMWREDMLNFRKSGYAEIQFLDPTVLNLELDCPCILVTNNCFCPNSLSLCCHFMQEFKMMIEMEQNLCLFKFKLTIGIEIFRF